MSGAGSVRPVDFRAKEVDRVVVKDGLDVDSSVVLQPADRGTVRHGGRVRVVLQKCTLAASLSCRLTTAFTVPKRSCEGGTKASRPST